MNHPIASTSPGIRKASTGKLEARARRNSKPDAEGRLKDAYLGGLIVEVAEKLAAPDFNVRNHGTSLNLNRGGDHEKEVTGELVASRNSENSGNPDAGSKKWPHNFHVSPAVVPHMEKVYSIVRQIYGRSPMDDLIDLDVNIATWYIFMDVTLQAAVHLGRYSVENLRFTKNQFLKSVKQLFQVTEMLIQDQTEISGLTTIDYEHPTWRSTALLCDKAVEITNAKTYVFSYSVLCLRGISDQPVEAWKSTLKSSWKLAISKN